MEINNEQRAKAMREYFNEDELNTINWALLQLYTKENASNIDKGIDEKPKIKARLQMISDLFNTFNLHPLK